MQLVQICQKGIVLTHWLSRRRQVPKPTEVPPCTLKDLKLKQARWERLSREKCFPWFSTSHSFMGEWQQKSKSFPEFTPRALRACLGLTGNTFSPGPFGTRELTSFSEADATIAFLGAGVEDWSRNWWINQGSARLRQEKLKPKLKNILLNFCVLIGRIQTCNWCLD